MLEEQVNEIELLIDEFIEDDELVEITPDDIRLRKKVLDPKLRFRENGKTE